MDIYILIQSKYILQQNTINVYCFRCFYVQTKMSNSVTTLLHYGIFSAAAVIIKYI